MTNVDGIFECSSAGANYEMLTSQATMFKIRSITANEHERPDQNLLRMNHGVVGDSINIIRPRMLPIKTINFN